MRAPRGKPARPPGAPRRWTLASVLLACGAALALLQLLRRAPGAPVTDDTAGVCVAWRATVCGTQYSQRKPMEDLPCSATIRPSDKRVSGYCECADQRLHMAEVALLCGKGLSAEWKRARMSPFTCAAACADKWRRRGPSLREDPRDGCDALPEEAARPGGRGWTATAPPPLSPLHADLARDLWRSMDDAFMDANGCAVVLPPGMRGFGGSPAVDFVAAGRRMPARDVATARAQWLAFAAAMPPYPEPLQDVPALFTGRGVVIIGGGLQYMVPAWVALHALRRTGCALPVEMWFLAHEMPDAGLERALRGLGASVRNADEIYAGGSASVFRGFALKVAAVLFSRFEEVLYLDSDNVVLRDPTDLFEWGPYRESGLLLWPDYWAPSPAPDAFAVAPEAAAAANNRSVESGQLLLRKRAAWRPLMMTWFVNMQGPLYYRLLCSYMGTGDKETWAFGAALAGGPAPARVATPAGSAGVPGARHPEHLLSNTMIQHHPADGAPLFAHANMFKWTLDVPTDFARYTRRWRAVTPPGWDAAALAHGAPPLLAAGAPPPPPALAEAERGAWVALRALRCAPFFERYLALRRARFGEIQPDAFDAGAPPPAYRGMLLSEHAGGAYEKQFAWAWTWRGPRSERVAAR